MRGRPGCPTGQQKNFVEATAGSPLFSTKKGWVPPPHPPQCAHWGTYGLWWLRLDLTEQSPGLFDPPRGRLWTWELPCRASNPSAQWTRPTGHASQSFPARRRGKKIQSCFDRLRRPKHTSHPESASFAGAGRGASPILGAQRSGSQNSCLSQPAQPVGGPLRA